MELAVKFAIGITSVLNLKTMLLQLELLFAADHAPGVVGKSL